MFTGTAEIVYQKVFPLRTLTTLSFSINTEQEKKASSKKGTVTIVNIIMIHFFSIFFSCKYCVGILQLQYAVGITFTLTVFPIDMRCLVFINLGIKFEINTLSYFFVRHSFPYFIFTCRF